jgi:hypothetical protein
MNIKAQTKNKAYNSRKFNRKIQREAKFQIKQS